MSVMWIIIVILLTIVWVMSVVDIFRRHYSGWTMVGYLALVLIVPFIGSMIYWAVRKPTAAETEKQYLAQADRQRAMGSQPIEPSGR